MTISDAIKRGMIELKNDNIEEPKLKSRLLMQYVLNETRQYVIVNDMENLEKIVTELEKGDLNLDESISKFEEGIKISKECNKILEEAEKKITILLEKDGELKEENFETEE